MRPGGDLRQVNQVMLECVSSESGTQSEQVHPWAEITAAQVRITAPRSRDVPAGIRAKEQGRPGRDQSHQCGCSQAGTDLPPAQPPGAGTSLVGSGPRSSRGAQAGPSAAGAAVLQEGLTARLNRRSPCGHSHQEARGWPRWGHQHVGSGGPGRILAGYAGRSVLGPWDAGQGRPPAPRCLHPCPLWVSGPVRGSSGTQGRC